MRDQCLKKWKKARYMLWYMLCFFLFGVIDQRRGSAEGTVQMAAANCTGLVVAALLVPSLEWGRFRHKVYLWWTAACAVLVPFLCVFWHRFWLYSGPWITAVLNVVVWGYLVIYLFHERRREPVRGGLRQPLFWGIAAMFLLMFLSVHQGLEPLWCLLIFGGFCLAGIPKERREDFFQGMLNGLILWFFVQQTLAFGFRPYDYVRYRGLYTGETQNGIFYMIASCAFLCKWIWSKEQGRPRWTTVLWFGLSAGSIGFLLFTGGRSSLVGVFAATILAYTLYDVVYHKSFYRWLFHFAALLVCIAVSVPVVYGCIRYLPVILHHPIWFADEYREDESVRSFDPWNSERYISFERALSVNLERVLRMFGIRVGTDTEAYVSLPWVMTAYAEEAEGPGSSPDEPFSLPDLDLESSISIRKTIYAYYLRHLNLWGHRREESGFYLTRDVYYGHAHNSILQTAYDYGIVAGALYLGLTLYAIGRFCFCVIRRGDGQAAVCLVFLTAVFCYGMTEYGVVSGMITWLLHYLLLYFAGETKGSLGSPARIREERKKADERRVQG